MELISFQPIRFKFESFDIKLWYCGLMIKRIWNLIPDEYYQACCQPLAFNLHTGQ